MFLVEVKGKDHDYLLLPTGMLEVMNLFPVLPFVTIDTGEVVGGFFLSFLTFIILYNNLIPISLIVTLEVCVRACMRACVCAHTFASVYSYIYAWYMYSLVCTLLNTYTCYASGCTIYSSNFHTEG